MRIREDGWGEVEGRRAVYVAHPKIVRRERERVVRRGLRAGVFLHHDNITRAALSTLRDKADAQDGLLARNGQSLATMTRKGRMFALRLRSRYA